MRPSETPAARRASTAAYRERNAKLPRATERRCPRCEQTKPAGDFYETDDNKDRLSTYCRACGAEKAVEQRWLRKYGLTPERYYEMLAEQAGVCAICAETCSTNERLAVDHDHGTGRIRGLLCRRCNRAIGMLGDSPELLTKAAKYCLRYRKA